MRHFFRILLIAVFIIAGMRQSTFVAIAAQSPNTVYLPFVNQPLLWNTGCGGAAIAPINLNFERQILDLVNVERKNAGLQPLTWSDELASAARYHAADMAEDDYFDHSTYDRVNGELNTVCDSSKRIMLYHSGASLAIAENIAAGYNALKTPQEVMVSWMESKDHRAAILNPGYSVLGVGFYTGDGQYQNYWVQDFASR